jgi:hypothetical protein
MPIVLWQLPAPAGLAEGAVWGWLLVMIAAPARPRSRLLVLAAALLMAATAVAETRSLPAVTLGIAAGAISQLLFRALLLNRRKPFATFRRDIE